MNSFVQSYGKAYLTPKSLNNIRKKYSYGTLILTYLLLVQIIKSESAYLLYHIVKFGFMPSSDM